MADTQALALERQRRQSRIIWGSLALLMALFLLLPVRLPSVVGPQAQSLYDAVERVPQNKLVLLSITWSASTIGENYPQTEAMIQHLFMARKRFAIFGIDPIGPTLAHGIAERHAKRLGRKYGVDWVTWGYRPGETAMFLGLRNDIPGTIQRDQYGTDITKIPVMRGVKSARDLGLIIEATASDSVGTWIAYFRGGVGVPVGYMPTSIMAPEAYPYLQTGQLVGMLTGIKGAAEYAILVGRRPGATLTWEYPPVRAMNAISIAHVLIVVLIIIGNTQYFMQRRRQRENA